MKNSYSSAALLALMTGLLFASGCSLRAPDSVRLQIDLSGASNGGNAKTRALTSKSGHARNMTELPSTSAGFNCYAITVYGSNMGGDWGNSPAKDIGCAFPGAEAPIVDGSTNFVELSVPSGRARTIQVVGITMADGGCPVGKKLHEIALPETIRNFDVAVLGQATLDLYGDSTVEIPNSYDPASPVLPLGCRNDQNIYMGPTFTDDMIATGQNHTCAIVQGGVKCWGNNSTHQLGDGTSMTMKPLPSAVLGIVNPRMIRAGGFHTCVQQVDGQVLCWGDNSVGQTGNSSISSATATPSPVTLATGAVRIATGGNHSCALLGNNTVWCWGGNAMGQLGNGSTTDSPAPVKVLGFPTPAVIRDVFAGDQRSCALTLGDQLYCWGDHGGVCQMFGEGTACAATAGPIATAVNNINSLATTQGGIRKVILGATHSCVLFGSGEIWCAGDNALGQLGIGNVAPQQSYVPIVGSGGVADTGWTDLAGGYYRTCGLKGNSIYCWGQNATSFDPSPFLFTVFPDQAVFGIAVGNTYSCAGVSFSMDGMKCWGGNGFGQLGTGDSTSVSYPSDVIGLTQEPIRISAPGSTISPGVCTPLYISLQKADYTTLPTFPATMMYVSGVSNTVKFYNDSSCVNPLAVVPDTYSPNGIEQIFAFPAWPNSFAIYFQAPSPGMYSFWIGGRGNFQYVAGKPSFNAP